MNIRLPNGDVLEGVPEGTTKEQIIQKLGYDPSTSVTSPSKLAAQDSNIVDRLGKDAANRADNLAEIARKRQSGELGFASAPLAVIGEGAGLAADVVQEGVVSLFRLLPDPAEDLIRISAGTTTEEVLKTEVGKKGIKALQAGSEAWSEFEKKHPKAASNIKSTLNILSIMPSTGFAGKTIKSGAKEVIKGGVKVLPNKIGGALETIAKDGVKKLPDKAANALNIIAKTREAKGKLKAAESFVLPQRTAKVAQQQAKTLEKNSFGNYKISLDARQQKMAETVAAIPEYKPSANDIDNYQTIVRTTEKMADDLTKQLEDADILISKENVKRRLVDKMMEEGKKGTTISLNENGSLPQKYKTMLKRAEGFLDEEKGTAAGVHNARKKLDFWARSERPTTFDGGKEWDKAYKYVRNEMNSAVDEAASWLADIDVAASRTKQNLLYEAANNTMPKAANVPLKVIDRIGKTILKKLDLTKYDIKRLGILGGAKTLGYNIPKAVVTELAKLGVKGVMSPRLQSSLSWLLKKLDEAIELEGNAKVIEKMRLDRGALLNLIEQPNSSEEKK